MRFAVYCATVEVLHRTSKWGEVRRLSCPIKALSFCRPTELRAERWYAVPKGAETAGLGRFLGLNGLMAVGFLRLTQPGAARVVVSPWGDEFYSAACTTIPLSLLRGPPLDPQGNMS